MLHRMSYAAPWWATKHPLGYAAPCWATLHPLSCYATQTELTLFVQIVIIPECRYWYRNEINANTGTGLLPEYREPVQHRNVLVPNWNDGYRNIDASGIRFDANAQLCWLLAMLHVIFDVLLLPAFLLMLCWCCCLWCSCCLCHCRCHCCPFFRSKICCCGLLQASLLLSVLGSLLLLVYPDIPVFSLLLEVLVLLLFLLLLIPHVSLLRQESLCCLPKFTWIC